MIHNTIGSATNKSLKSDKTEHPKLENCKISAKANKGTFDSSNNLL